MEKRSKLHSYKFVAILNRNKNKLISDRVKTHEFSNVES